MEIVLGIIFTALFASGLLTQVVRLHQRKIAEDVSVLTYCKWLIGFALATSVAIMTKAHWIFTIGYILQGVLTAYTLILILHYRRDLKLRMERIRRDVMEEVRKEGLKVHEGGKK